MKRQTLIITGGGTGGHVTPLVAIVKELRKIKQLSSLRIVYVGQKGDEFSDILNKNLVDEKIQIRAGKWRRYQTGIISQLLDVRTVLKNIRDLFWLKIGFFQSMIIIKKYQPKLIFSKGGYVGVPIGLAAARKKIPIITHDSDAHPGLANRVLARWVVTHLVAFDVKYYDYPKDDTIKVGIPLREEFSVGGSDKSLVADKYQLKSDQPIIVILGGSLGGLEISKQIVAIRDKLTQLGQVVHICGQTAYSELSKDVTKRYKIYPFIAGDELAELMKASDLIITRAGSTTLAEAAALGKPMIIIPNKQLTKDHQSLNAKIYAEQAGVPIVDQDEFKSDHNLLLDQVKQMLDPSKAKDVSSKLKRMMPVDSAKKTAKIIAEHLNSRYGVK